MSHAEIFNAALDMYNEGWKPDWEDGTTASLGVVTI